MSVRLWLLHSPKLWLTDAIPMHDFMKTTDLYREFKEIENLSQLVIHTNTQPNTEPPRVCGKRVAKNVAKIKLERKTPNRDLLQPIIQLLSSQFHARYPSSYRNDEEQTPVIP
jgi:regulator of PEP synthase PpsR (kinase-PPPase family)